MSWLQATLKALASFLRRSRPLALPAACESPYRRQLPVVAPATDECKCGGLEGFRHKGKFVMCDDPRHFPRWVNPYVMDWDLGEPPSCRGSGYCFHKRVCCGVEWGPPRAKEPDQQRMGGLTKAQIDQAQRTWVKKIKANREMWRRAALQHARARAKALRQPTPLGALAKRWGRFFSELNAGKW